MYLSRLEISRVRNLQRVQCRLVPGLNLFYGENGAGKTSVLEAVEMLALGRSFRTREALKIVTRGEAELVVFGVACDESGSCARIGVAKGRSAGTRVRVDGQDVRGFAEVASRLPVVGITPWSHEVIEGPPGGRRRLLDWGVFHVEQSFLDAWRQFHRGLRQRNALLRERRASAEELAAWDKGFVEAAERVERFRASYLDAWLPWFERICSRFEIAPVKVRYRRGWPADVGLREALRESAAQDLERGFTHRGPHRADLQLLAEGQAARDVLSRGQQKRLFAVLRLAQVEHLWDASGLRCIVLFDDVAAELDEVSRRGVMAALAETGAQVLATVIDQESVEVTPFPDVAMFHVEHGSVTQVL